MKFEYILIFYSLFFWNLVIFTLTMGTLVSKIDSWFERYEGKS